MSQTIQFTPYLATAYAEGFCEGEDASEYERLQAFAYLVKTGVAYSLQGFFGRTAESLIEAGYIDRDGNVLVDPEELEVGNE